MTEPDMLTLILHSDAFMGPMESKEWDADEIAIGRGAACNMALPDPSVSQRHATIRRDGSDYLLVDEGSANGTFVGKTRLEPQTPHRLRNGDLCRIGSVWIEVRTDAVQVLAPEQLERHVAQEAEDDAPLPRLLAVRVTSGKDIGQVMCFGIGATYIIGRNRDRCALFLADSGVSREHVRVTRAEDGEVTIRDLGSRNGTWMLGALVPPHREVPWMLGVEICVGDTRIELVTASWE